MINTKLFRNFYDEWHINSKLSRSSGIRDRDLIALKILSDCTRVFELGCGNGLILSMLNVESVAGVDVSAVAIEMATKQVKGCGQRL